MAWVIRPRNKDRWNEQVCSVLFNDERSDEFIARDEFGLYSAGDDINHLTHEEACAFRHAINVRVLQLRYYIRRNLPLPELDKSKPYVRRVFDICAARPELTRAHYPWLNR